jgi:hypothetical protein
MSSTSTSSAPGAALYIAPDQRPGNASIPLKPFIVHQPDGVILPRSDTTLASEASLRLLSEFDDICQRLKTASEALINGDVSLAACALPFAKLFTPLVKLYAVASEAAGAELTPVSQDATATEVAMLACGLLRAEGLNPFDLALCFARTA